MIVDSVLQIHESIVGLVHSLKDLSRKDVLRPWFNFRISTLFKNAPAISASNSLNKNLDQILISFIIHLGSEVKINDLRVVFIFRFLMTLFSFSKFMKYLLSSRPAHSSEHDIL